MRRYSEAVKADVRRRMSPPHRQSVAQISAELGIHVVTLYNWRKTWRLQGEVVPASEKGDADMAVRREVCDPCRQGSRIRVFLDLEVEHQDHSHAEPSPLNQQSTSTADSKAVDQDSGAHEALA